MLQVRTRAKSPLMCVILKTRVSTREGLLQTLRAITLSILGFLYFVASVSFVLADGGATDRLLAGDRLTVTVFGQPDMSGVFQVNGDGDIEMPIVGAIPVGQLTIKEAQKRIESRLADGYILHPAVSIIISELRPIYVVGDVKAPGTFPFRHGSSVLNAIAQAGGYGGAEQPLLATALAEFLLSEERVQTLESTRLMLSIRKARLEAQLDGQATFEAPLYPAAGAEAKQLTTAIANERDALRDQTQALKQQLDLLHGQKPRLEAATVAVEQQIESQKRQMALVQDQLKDWATLKAKGLGLRTTEVTLLREQSTLDITISGFRTELARLSVTMGDLDIRIHDTEAAEHRRISGELQEVRTRLNEVETILPTARRVREVRLQQTDTGASTSSVRPSHRIVIRRTMESAVQTLGATEETLLQPGDIVEVIWVTPSSNVSAYRGTESRAQARLDSLVAGGVAE